MKHQNETEKRKQKKEVKHQMNHVAKGIIFYTIISLVVVMVDIFAKMIPILIRTSNEQEQDKLLDAMLLEWGKQGTSMIIGVVLGIVFLFWFFRREQPIKTIFLGKRKMDGIVFLQILSVFMGVQLLFFIGDEVLESCLNIIGYTAAGSVETATANSETISMFLYASFIGPIAEELVYRGVVMRSLQRYGKLFAIVVSAVLFGVMHANLPQGMFAFCVGLILAYVATEYSIKWSIVLHILNNCVFGELFYRVILNFPKWVQNILDWGTAGTFFLTGTVILWKKRREIKTYISQNKTEKKYYVYTFTAVWMALFIICELALAITDLQRI